MLDCFNNIIDFLDQVGFNHSAKTLKLELDQTLNSKKKFIEPNRNLIKMISKSINEKNAREIKQRVAITRQREKTMQNKKVEPQLYNQQEVDNVMEKLMNRLVGCPTLLEDEKLNAKIEKFFENPTFQKMVEQTDVFNDISNLSFTNSMMKGKGGMSQSQSQSQFNPDYNSNILQNQSKQKIDNPYKLKQQKNSFDNIEGIPQSTSNNNIEPFREEKVSEIIHAEDEKDNWETNIVDKILDPINVEDEYQDDDDQGFIVYEVREDQLANVSKQLAQQHNFPERAIKITKAKKAGNESNQSNNNGSFEQSVVTEKTEVVKEKKKEGRLYLPNSVCFPNSNHEFYPVEFDKTVYDIFRLTVIFDRERTGFEETKDFPIVINSIIAGRYQIIQFLGQAAFSKAIQVMDITNNQVYCMKVIENNKDYFDQSIDEIKLLNYINFNGDVDEKNVLKVYDYFYHKEHLFIVTELLKYNLYEFSTYNRQNEDAPYFTVGRLQKISQQILIGLDYINSLSLIHCDLKPENILMKSFSKCEVKVIDFGSSCFIHDHLSSYIQSRSYRAPEVIIGCKYDYKIDMWSLGCILAELWTGNVLFQNESVQGLLSRMISIVGPFPDWMIESGRLVNQFFTKEKLIYQEVYEDNNQGGGESMNESNNQSRKQRTGKVQLLIAKKSSLKARLRCEDDMFVDFVRQLLEIDTKKRMSAQEALQHPWLTNCKYAEGL